MFNKHTAATACPFCDNPVLIPSRFSGDLRPDLVIPFRLDKEQAKAALEQSGNDVAKALELLEG